MRTDPSGLLVASLLRLLFQVLLYSDREERSQFLFSLFSQIQPVLNVLSHARGKLLRNEVATTGNSLPGRIGCQFLSLFH